jgi:hypothetical protein
MQKPRGDTESRRRTPLRPGAEAAASIRGRHITFDLPEDLCEVTAGGSKPKGLAVSNTSIDPSLASSGTLDLSRSEFKCFLTPRSPRDVPQDGAIRGSQLQAVMEGLSPGAQVDGPLVAGGNRQSKKFCKEPQRPFDVRGQQLHMSDLGDGIFEHGTVLVQAVQVTD